MEKETLEETRIHKLRAKCALCWKSFIRKRHLKRHIAKKHEDGVNMYDIKGQRYTCSRKYNDKTCEKQFLTGPKLKRHIKSHRVTESGNHKCEICEKPFPSSSSLFLHRNIHLEEKPFKCDDCYKGFAQKGNLKDHIQKYHNKDGDTFSESFNTILFGEVITIKAEGSFSGISRVDM